MGVRLKWQAKKPSAQAAAGQGAAGRESGKKNMWARYAQDVAEAVVKLIEEGAAKPVQGWSGGTLLCRPHSLIYGKPYGAINALLLMAEGVRRGQGDMRFVTRSAVSKLKEADGSRAALKPDAKPFYIWQPKPCRPIVLPADADLSRYKPEELEQREDGTVVWHNPVMRFRPLEVFSASDTTADLPPLPGAELAGEKVLTPDFQPCEFMEKFTEACGMKLVREGNQPCYVPSDDAVMMPVPEHFVNEGEYYGTLAHEFYHWTGGKGRENRLKGDRKSYATEEIQAELFAAMSSVSLGLGSSFAGHAGYIDVWNKRLDDDPVSIYRAAQKSKDMLDVLLDVAEGVHPSPAWLKNADFSGVPAPLKEMRSREAELEREWRIRMGFDRTKKEAAPAAVQAVSTAAAPAVEAAPAESAAPALEAMVRWVYNDPETGLATEGRAVMPIESSAEVAETLARVMMSTWCRDYFVPEDVGLPEKRTAFEHMAAEGADVPPDAEPTPAVCEHELALISIREAGRDRGEKLDHAEAASFEEFATAFLSRAEDNSWNRYDPDGFDESKPMEYAGPGWVAPSREQIDACLAEAGEIIRAAAEEEEEDDGPRP